MTVRIRLEVELPRRARRRRPLRWTIGPVAEQRVPLVVPSGVAMLQLTDTQQCPLAVQPLDRKGHPAAIDEASVVWTSSDPAVATVTGDGLTATVVAGDPGTTQVNVAIDADLGEGVRTLNGTLDVTVVAGDAASLAMRTGVPVDQPEPAPVA